MRVIYPASLGCCGRKGSRVCRGYQVLCAFKWSAGVALTSFWPKDSHSLLFTSLGLFCFQSTENNPRATLHNLLSHTWYTIDSIMTHKMFQPHIITKSCKTHLLDKFQYWKVFRCWGGVLTQQGTRCSKRGYKYYKPWSDFGQRHCFSGLAFCTCKWKEMARIRNLKTLRIKTSKGFSIISVFKLNLTWNRYSGGGRGSASWPLPTWRLLLSLRGLTLEAHLQGHRAELESTNFYTVMNRLAI